MKSKRCIVNLLFILFSVLALSCNLSVSAASSSKLNKQAHKAYVKQLKKAKKKYCDDIVMTKLKYAYRDIDNDNVDELIIYPSFGYCYQAVYDYQNNKVKQVATVGQGPFTKYYPKKKILYAKDVGHMDVLQTQYYVQKNGVYKLTACISKHYPGNYDEAPDKIYYYIGISQKEVSKSEFQRYVKKLLKGDSGKKFSSIKWKKY